MVFQTYAEVEFLKAEAAIRGWTSGDAKTHYENGVKAAMMMLKDIYPASTAITAAEADAYLAGAGDASTSVLVFGGGPTTPGTFLAHTESWNGTIKCSPSSSGGSTKSTAFQ